MELALNIRILSEVITSDTDVLSPSRQKKGRRIALLMIKLIGFIIDPFSQVLIMNFNPRKNSMTFSGFKFI
jgi:hypothetical protein